MIQNNNKQLCETLLNCLIIQPQKNIAYPDIHHWHTLPHQHSYCTALCIDLQYSSVRVGRTHSTNTSGTPACNPAQGKENPQTQRGTRKLPYGPRQCTLHSDHTPPWSRTGSGNGSVCRPPCRDSRRCHDNPPGSNRRARRPLSPGIQNGQSTEVHTADRCISRPRHTHCHNHRKVYTGRPRRLGCRGSLWHPGRRPTRASKRCRDPDPLWIRTGMNILRGDWPPRSGRCFHSSLFRRGSCTCSHRWRQEDRRRQADSHGHPRDRN